MVFSFKIVDSHIYDDMDDSFPPEMVWIKVVFRLKFHMYGSLNIASFCVPKILILIDFDARWLTPVVRSCHEYILKLTSS